jgi:single-stranded DNA-binding protein
MHTYNVTPPSWGTGRVWGPGMLASDPEPHHVSAGKGFTTFIIVRDPLDDKADPKQWDILTSWYRIRAEANLAIACNKYLHQGCRIYFEGLSEISFWEDRQVQRRFIAIEVTAMQIWMRDPRKRIWVDLATLTGVDDGDVRPC